MAMASFNQFTLQPSVPPQPNQGYFQPPPQHKQAEYAQRYNVTDPTLSSTAFPVNYAQIYSQLQPNPTDYQQNSQLPPPPPTQPYQYQPPPPMSQSSTSMHPQSVPPLQGQSFYYGPSQFSQYSYPLQALPPPPPQPQQPQVPPLPPRPPSPPSPVYSPPPLPDMTKGKHKKQERSKPKDSRHDVVDKKPSIKLPDMRAVKSSSQTVERVVKGNERSRKETEKYRREESHKQKLKEMQNTVLQRTQMLSAHKEHGSIGGSLLGDRGATTLFPGERIDNRLKKPTTFLCKLRFRNELPDPSAQPKLMNFRNDKDRYSKYMVTSLDKFCKPQLFVEPDLGIPLDLLDLSVYNRPSVRPPLAPEDEDLFDGDDMITPVRKDTIKRKERPKDIGVPWLVKTQYISPLSLESNKQSMTEKQAKELREMRGLNLLENMNSRERKIKDIVESFEACKTTPVHTTNKKLQPVEILPLLPNFDRFEDKFVTVTFDSSPTADSRVYGKLEKQSRDDYESQAVMKACVATGTDSDTTEKFLAYMIPSLDESVKDTEDDEGFSYTWVREYHWDVRGDDTNDPTTFLLSFHDKEARYTPLPTKINLKRKRAGDGRPGSEAVQIPTPSSIMMKNRPTVAVMELKDDVAGRSSKNDLPKKAQKLENGEMALMLEEEEEEETYYDNGESATLQHPMKDVFDDESE